MADQRYAEKYIPIASMVNEVVTSAGICGSMVVYENVVNGGRPCIVFLVVPDGFGLRLQRQLPVGEDGNGFVLNMIHLVGEVHEPPLPLLKKYTT